MKPMDAALTYAERGIPVFPLPSRRKTPATAHGFHDATTDTAQIRAWWRRRPDGNIGIRPPAGVIVVDVDPRNGGDRELARMIRFRGPLPETWTARTGSDGLHYWYTIKDVDEIRGHIGEGIDIKRGATGYVVAPPSIHPNGNTYEWLIPPTGEPAQAPHWLQLAIQPPVRLFQWYQPRGDTSAGSGPYTLGCLLGRINAAQDGRRNTIVYGALKDALRQGDLDAFESDLVGAALATGLDDDEVQAIVKSVRKSGAA